MTDQSTPDPTDSLIAAVSALHPYDRRRLLSTLRIRAEDDSLIYAVPRPTDDLTVSGPFAPGATHPAAIRDAHLASLSPSTSGLTTTQTRRLALSTEVRVRGIGNDATAWEFRSRSNKKIPVRAFAFSGSLTSPSDPSYDPEDPNPLSLVLHLSDIAIEGSLVASILLPDAETEAELLSQVRSLAASLGHGLYPLEDPVDDDL